MIIKLSKPLNLFVLGLSVTVVLAFVPQQLDARGGARGGGGGGGARTSINRGSAGNMKASSGANRSSNRSQSANRSTDKNRSSDRDVDRNRDVNRDIDVDVDVDHGCCWGGGVHHPIAAGVAVGAAVAVTAAAIGSVVYTLPAGCTTVVTNGVSYSQCGSVWYQPTYSGNDVTYIVVDAP